MNINRNNYEAFFLLYADKELTASERYAVEMFVKQNTDLEEEFIMLQQTVVKPDTTIAFTHKDILFRKESFIDHGNYEEKFLLYTDNELNAQEREATQQFVSENPTLQPEFAFMQKVTYTADSAIVFPDKRSLYKKEEVARVIPFRWRALAAAVLLGIGLWTGINYVQTHQTKPGVAARQNIPAVNSPVTPKNVKAPAQNPLVKTDVHEKEPERKAPETDMNPVQQPPRELTVKNIPLPVKKEVIPLDQKNENTVVMNEDPATTGLIKPTDNGLPATRTTEPADKTLASPTAVKNNYAIPASYMTEANEKSENYVFYNITAEEFRKSKIGNFLKKAKRAIAAKLPLKNGLKIGNVEIAKDDQN